MKKIVLFVKTLIMKFNADEVSTLSSQLAYSLLLSLMPFLIFLLTLIGFTAISSKEVLDYLTGIMPRDALRLVEKTVVEVVDEKNGNLLSFSLLAAIWAASGGAKTIIRCLNRAYEEREKRGFIKIQIIAVVFTIGLVLLLFSTIILLVFGNVIGDYITSRLRYPAAFKFTWDLLRYVIMVVVMLLIFFFTLHYMPSRRLTWKEVIPGALFATAGWIIISIGFSYYVDNFANYSRLYGSIAAVFILMAWIYLSSVILMLGGEINAVLALNLKNKL